MRELWHFVRAFQPAAISRAQREGGGGARQVLVVPGLMANDRSMLPLRLALRARGYRAYGWKLGTNTGATPDLLDRLHARVCHIQRSSGEPVIVVGWSLGGLIAREYAKRAPDRVAAVITLASPFSGDMRATWIARVYEWVAGHSLAAIPIACTLHEKPPVPTAAIWSACDGVIPAAAARGEAGEADFALEIACAHMVFPRAKAAHDAVFEAIAQCRTLGRPARRVSPDRPRPMAIDRRPRQPAARLTSASLVAGHG